MVETRLQGEEKKEKKMSGESAPVSLEFVRQRGWRGKKKEEEEEKEELARTWRGGGDGGVVVVVEVVR